MSTSSISNNYHAIGKLYAGMTKESIRADMNAMTFQSEAEREKAYNKQIKLFDYANSLIEGEVDDVISQQEIEAYNKKEKTKKTWKTIGLVALGVGAIVGGIFLARNLKFRKDIYSSIDNFCINRYGGTCNSQERKSLFNVITNNGDKAMAKQRLDILKNHPSLADMFVDNTCSNGTFILDNIQGFEKILTRQNRKLLGPEYHELIGKINTKESLQALCQTVDSPATFKRKALEIIYNSNNHTITFGKEMVEADSSFLVHLLSGRQYYCSDSEFNKMAEMLAEKNSRKGGLYYNKIAEGILKQKPELKAVISQFEAYCEQINGLESSMKVQKIKEFFRQLSKDGILPEKIKLRTIIPDENAFADVRNTLFLYS